MLKTHEQVDPNDLQGLFLHLTEGSSFMKRSCVLTWLWMAAFILPSLLHCRGNQGPPENRNDISLPRPRWSGTVSVEEALHQRRSIRSYTDETLSLEELSQLLWSAQGITSTGGLRTAPSAGALYPLEVYVAAGRVEKLDSGLYRYIPEGHRLSSLGQGNFRETLSDAALEEPQVEQAAANIIITAVYARTTEKYGERGIRYAHMEAGHAGQNILLQAQGLNLGACPVGAFEDDRLKSMLRLTQGEDPLYIISVGRMNQP